MKASEAAAIAEQAQITSSHQYNTVIQIIKAAASNGDRRVDLPLSAVPKGVFKKLEQDGYDCTYIFNDFRICW